MSVGFIVIKESQETEKKKKTGKKITKFSIINDLVFYGVGTGKSIELHSYMHLLAAFKIVQFISKHLSF